jgi:hypothetical protein
MVVPILSGLGGLGGLGGLAGLVAGAAAEEPVLHVRARLRVDIDAIERVPGGLVVRGQLRDDASEEPVASRTIAISVEGDHGFYH